LTQAVHNAAGVWHVSEAFHPAGKVFFIRSFDLINCAPPNAGDAILALGMLPKREILLERLGCGQ
jgi:hypothetical protein